jgi:hypothetical protein
MEQTEAVTRIRDRAHGGNATEKFQVDSHEKVKTGNLGALTLMMSSRGASQEIRVHLPESRRNGMSTASDLEMKAWKTAVTLP